MRHHLAILGFLVLSACGGADPKSAVDDGNTALGKGDYAGALEAFEATLAGLDMHHPQYRRAALGRCEALARLDPVRAKSVYLELAKTQPDLVTENDYSLMSAALLEVEANLEAVHVIHAGKDRFPKSQRMQEMLEAVIHAAERAKEPAALDELRRLGYV